MEEIRTDGVIFVTVSKKTKQTEETLNDQRDWSWVEPAVWTQSMLTALQRGVKGGRWFSLIDKVYNEGNMLVAFKSVACNKGAAGVDHVSIKDYERHLSHNIRKTCESLKERTYRPKPIRRQYIPKAGSKEMRPLGIPAVGDRVVQTALRNVLEPIFERDFAERSYGFRPGRSCKDALREVDRHLRSGYRHVVDADLKSYFDTIPHSRLIKRVEEKVSDGRVLELLELFIKQQVMDGLDAWTPEEGSPQGAVISPLLSNLYLDPLDHLMETNGIVMVRYADDFVLLCQSAEEAGEALEQVRNWIRENGLQLHPEKTRIVNMTQPNHGFDFLGYHFHTRGEDRKIKRYPSRKSEKKFKDSIRTKTRKCNGHSMEAIIGDLNRTLRGWFEYFKHSEEYVFKRLDSWIRRRLRTILRKRTKRKGGAWGWDNMKWPNAFFQDLGLFSLYSTHVILRQSLRS
jgi:RNA-directed DNA polymerase